MGTGCHILAPPPPDAVWSQLCHPQTSLGPELLARLGAGPAEAQAGAGWMGAAVPFAGSSSPHWKGARGCPPPRSAWSWGSPGGSEAGGLVWKLSGLASSGTEFPPPSGLPLSPLTTFWPLSPPNRRPPAPQLLPDPRCSTVPPSPSRALPRRSLGWDRELTVSPGLSGSRFWTDRRGCECGWESCVWRPVSCGPPPADPLRAGSAPSHTEAQRGQGARSGHRRPLSPGLQQAALCPVLQPQSPPPPAGPRQAQEGAGKGLGRTLRSPSAPPPNTPPVPLVAGRAGKAWSLLKESQ